MFWYLADTFVVKDTLSLMKVRGVVPVMSSHWAGDVPPVIIWGFRRLSSLCSVIDDCKAFSPVILQRSRRLGVVSPLYPFITPSPERGGTGMVMVMGLWNFLLRGSTVTIGLKVARFPTKFFTTSFGRGWACRKMTIYRLCPPNNITNVTQLVFKHVNKSTSYWKITVLIFRTFQFSSTLFYISAFLQSSDKSLWENPETWIHRLLLHFCHDFFPNWQMTDNDNHVNVKQKGNIVSASYLIYCQISFHITILMKIKHVFTT